MFRTAKQLRRAILGIEVPFGRLNPSRRFFPICSAKNLGEILACTLEGNHYVDAKNSRVRTERYCDVEVQHQGVPASRYDEAGIATQDYGGVNVQ